MLSVYNKAIPIFTMQMPDKTFLEPEIFLVKFLNIKFFWTFLNFEYFCFE